MKLQSIQVLRGLAALLVVFYHIRALEIISITANGLNETPYTGGIFANGYAGVDLFFVISGFIMVYVTEGLKNSVMTSAEFLFARMTRIYPVWWLFAGIATVYFILVHTLSGAGPGWQDISGNQPLIPYILNSLALVPQPGFPILSVGWTLIHEVYFYLVFTFLLLLPRKWLPGLLLIWGIAILGGSLAGLSNEIAVNFLTLIIHPVTMNFILGALVAVAITSGINWRPGIISIVAGLWFLISLCYQTNDANEMLLWGRVLWFGLPSAALIFGLAQLDQANRLAWLLPVAAGIFVSAAVFQLYGLNHRDPDGAIRGATIVATLVGTIALFAILWFGWLGGQAMPARLRQLEPALQRILHAMVRLGDWSFSLYLCHILVLSLLRHAFEALGQIGFLSPVFRLGTPGPLDNMAFLIIGLALSITASGFAYRLYEKPSIILFGNIRKKLFNRRHHAEASA